MKKYSFSAVLISAFVGIVVCTAAFALLFFTKFGDSREKIRATAKFASIYETIEQNFIVEADMQNVSDSAYATMVKALDDQWSYYMTADEFEMYKEYQSNSYTGIGITIAVDENSNYMRVIGISEDSPAARAGVLIGDLLTSIDGEPLIGKSSAEIKSIIFERDGRGFTLSLISQDGRNRDLVISTEAVKIDPVIHRILDSDIGYVKIKNFEQNSGTGIIEAAESLLSQGAVGMVFDVRNNPGGMLSELLIALDYLLPEGKMFVSVDKDGKENVSYSDSDCVRIPMTVLVNANTYSAAEFFAQGLSEYDMAKIIGSKTTGKSRSQVNFVLNDGSAVHISTNKYLTPSGIDLAQVGGIIPNMEVNLSNEDTVLLVAGLLDMSEDEQLQAAITILMNS